MIKKEVRKKQKATAQRKMLSMVYDRKGRPMELKKWACEMTGNRHVAKQHLWFGLVYISTVWLGLDHSFGIGKKPLIYESMAFVGDWGGVEQVRYATVEEARIGHKKMVAKYSRPLTVAPIVCGMVWEKLKSLLPRRNR